MNEMSMVYSLGRCTSERSQWNQVGRNEGNSTTYAIDTFEGEIG